MLDQSSVAPAFHGGRGRTSGEGAVVSDPTAVGIRTDPPGEAGADAARRGGGAAEHLRVDGWYVRMVKPLADRVLALVALGLAAPVMVVIALAIRLTMGRGVIFVQARVGKDGHPFWMYKFRTMRPDRRRRCVAVSQERRKTHKHPNDPRLTPVGRFLRTWSLDELPQFVNVLRGDMSVIGPRPEMVDLVDRYEPWQHGRHVVKPGLTGLWQISDRGDLLMHECVERDIQYIDRLSWRTDLSILLRTPAAMVGSRRGF